MHSPGVDLLYTFMTHVDWECIILLNFLIRLYFYLPAVSLRNGPNKVSLCPQQLGLGTEPFVFGSWRLLLNPNNNNWVHITTSSHTCHTDLKVI